MNTRSTIVHANNIVLTDEIKATLSKNFKKCVNGYHKVNNTPIKESFWEEINAEVLHESGYPNRYQSNGSHSSGKDLSTALGDFSNKSGIVSPKNTFDISSYRLTTVCSSKNPGNISQIIAEINKRKNFHYYSLLLRKDSPRTNALHYMWYLIPADYDALNPISYTWSLDDKKWFTDVKNGSSMSITFSMSSQLWIKVAINEDLKQFLVGECIVPVGRTMNYIQLEDIYETYISPNLPVTSTASNPSNPSIPSNPSNPCIPTNVIELDNKSVSSGSECGRITIPEIKAELKSLGIKGYSGKNKKELLDMFPEGHAMRSLPNPLPAASE